MDGGVWLGLTHGDIYHGKAVGEGGPAWVYQRVHTVHGPYVEVHAGEPDGELVRRVTVQHVTHGRAIVQDLRDAIRRGGVDAVAGEVDPVGGRGVLDLHAASSDTVESVASIDGIDPTLTCARIWLTPGEHVVQAAFTSMSVADFGPPLKLRAPRWRTEQIMVDAGQKIVLFHSLFGDRLERGVPRLHWPCGVRQLDRSLRDA